MSVIVLSAGRRRRRRSAVAIKRLADIAGSLIAIVLLSPLFLLAATLVKLQDGGPVIFRRRVVGRNGDFDAFKFRSMRIDADEVLHGNPAMLAEYRRNHKLIDDPRVTPLGRFLRKSSIDELPQLFNVLAGQMSLIGPRMITRPELEKYDDAGDLLLTAKPGMTGYWQVEGRQTTTYEERVRMDIWYIENWSLLLDLTILLKTPIRVLKGEGAY